MIRLRWFSVEPVSVLLSAMTHITEAKHYDRATATDWFDLTRVTKNRVDSTYIEKIVIEDKVEDPFGNVDIYERVEYRKTEFAVSTEFPQLLLRNSPRSRRNFLARIGELANHEIAVEPVRLNVLATISNLEKLVGRLTVSELIVCGYPLSARASAEIVVSGSDDIRSDAERFTRHRYATVKSAITSWRQRDDIHSCEISTTGICIYEDFPQLERLARSALIHEEQ